MGPLPIIAGGKLVYRMILKAKVGYIHVSCKRHIILPEGEKQHCRITSSEEQRDVVASDATNPSAMNTVD